MNAWEDSVLPSVVDRALSSTPINRERALICAGLRGRVLEFGFGSGTNVEFYPEEVRQVVAIEPSERAWKISDRRRSANAIDIRLGGDDAQSVAEPDGSFDCVLATFSLCTIPDVAQALSEAKRVLKPSGVFHVLEHGSAPDARVARWQHRLEPIQKVIAGGCHLTRDMPRLIEAAGFKIAQLEAGYLPGPPIARPWMYAYRLTAQQYRKDSRGTSPA